MILSRGRVFASAAVAVVVVGVGVSAGIASGSSSAPAVGSWQTAQRHVQTGHMSSTKWKTVGGRQFARAGYLFNVVSSGHVRLWLSLKLGGAPVQLRVRDNGKVLRPHSLTVNPTRTDNAFSYTFIDTGKNVPCGHTFRLQWRSPSGDRVSLQQGNAVISYRVAKNLAPGGCG